MKLNKFQSILNENMNLKTRLKPENDINMAVQSLTEIIQSTAWNSSSPKSHTNHNHISLPIHIRTLIVKKKKAGAIWQRTK